MVFYEGFSPSSIEFLTNANGEREGISVRWVLSYKRSSYVHGEIEGGKVSNSLKRREKSAGLESMKKSLRFRLRQP
jgi:hypothetical protein